MLSKRKTIAVILFTAFVVSMMTTNQTLASDSPLNPTQRILATPTQIEGDIFVESLELFAGRNQSIIAQANYLGGEPEIPFDLSAPEFDDMVAYVLYVGDQRHISSYWPRALAELRDGVTLAMSYKGISYTEAISRADAIKEAVEIEHGLELQPLFGVNQAGETAIAYYQPFTIEEMDAFVASEWWGSPYSDGFAPYSSANLLQNAPVRVFAHLLLTTDDPAFPGGWLPLNFAAYVVEDAIAIDEDEVYTFSLEEALGTTTVQGSVFSNYSHVRLRMPYVANVYSVIPETDNLFPEMTGNYGWTIRACISEANWEVINNYDDIELIYDLNTTELTTFPQVETVQSFDSDQLTTQGTLNYSITMTNTGNEDAKNIRFVQELGAPPENVTTVVFNSEELYHNASLQLYYDLYSGEMTFDEPSHVNDFNVTFVGWFQRVNDSAIVQPVTHYNESDSTYGLDFEATFMSLHINKTFFNFVHSDNFIEVEDLTYGEAENPIFGIEGTLDTLAINETEVFWWGIADLPLPSDIINVYDLDMQEYNNTHTHNDTIVVTWLINDTLSLKDFIIEDATSNGGDLRLPPGVIDYEWVSGLKFRYEDLLGREYFGLSNGLGIQIYDDEAVLVTSVTTDKKIYRAGDEVEINFTISNVGDTAATDIELTGYHAFMQPNWELGDIRDFYNPEETYTLQPNQNVTLTWNGHADTFIGIHPVFAAVSYTTDDGQGSGWDGEAHYDNVLSSLVNVIVLPPEYKDGEEEPSFPTPEVLVNTSIITDGNVTVGDDLEVHIAVTNVGDETTHIRVISYFWNKYLTLDRQAYGTAGGTVKVTDDEGILLANYTQGYVTDSDLQVTYVGAEGITLEPNETVHLYYTVKTEEEGVFVIPPVIVEFDSHYPMDTAGGEEGAPGGPEGQAAGTYLKAKSRLKSTLFRRSAKPNPTYSAVNAWSSSSNPTGSTIGKGDGTTPISEDTSTPSRRTGMIPGFELVVAALSLGIIPVVRTLQKRKR